MLIHRLFDENSEVFIGYHDINPFHLNNEIVLAHRAYSTTKLPKSNDQVDIGFFSILANKYVKISSSYAWSIQQGSRLRWFTSSEKNDSVSFNNRIKKKFVNEVFDFRTFKKINEFPFPVYDLNELCSRAAVIDFSLIYRFRKHYGYYSNSYPTNSVLKIIDLVKNISLHEITIEVKHSNNAAPPPSSQPVDHQHGKLNTNPTPPFESVTQPLLPHPCVVCSWGRAVIVFIIVWLVCSLVWAILAIAPLLLRCFTARNALTALPANENASRFEPFVLLILGVSAFLYVAWRALLGCGDVPTAALAVLFSLGAPEFDHAG